MSSLVYTKSNFSNLFRALNNMRGNRFSCFCVLSHHSRKRSNVLRMQYFDFCPNRIKFNQVYPNFTQLCSKFAQIGLNFAQICLKNLILHSQLLRRHCEPLKVKSFKILKIGRKRNESFSGVD